MASVHRDLHSLAPNGSRLSPATAAARQLKPGKGKSEKSEQGQRLERRRGIKRDPNEA